jgi:hypothetical protein
VTNVTSSTKLDNDNDNRATRRANAKEEGWDMAENVVLPLLGPQVRVFTLFPAPFSLMASV